jgi:hypothetical protein
MWPFIKISISCVFLLTLLGNCQKEEGIDSDSPVKIQWISGGTTITYTYSSGMLSGYYFYRGFEVSQGSGEVIVHIQVSNDNSSMITDTIEAGFGEEYHLKVHGSINGRQLSSPGSECMEIIFSSPQSGTTAEITVNSFMANIGGIDNFYCPKEIVLGSITVNN